MATEFLGYRYDLEDRESIQRDAAPYSELLKSSDWKEQELFSWWHVRNQGPKGSCRGHSLAANARLCYRMQAGSIDLDQDGIENESNLHDDFSPDWCYYRCQAASGIRGDNGATIEGGKRVGLEEGIVREIDLPYQTTYEPSRANDPQLRVKAQAFRFGRYSLLETAQAVFDWVGSGQGGIDWGTVWPLPFVGGCLVKDLSPSANGGGHATAGGCLIRGETLLRAIPNLRGHVRDDEWILQCMNSHSSSAQFRGFYFVTMAGCEAILRHRFTTAVGWSDMTTPVVRPFDFRKKSVFHW